MESEKRRQKIIELLKKQEEPISGSQLAEQFGVTRQVIVKDMGMIKAGGLPLLATAKGICSRKKQMVYIDEKSVYVTTENRLVMKCS